MVKQRPIRRSNKQDNSVLFFAVGLVVALLPWGLQLIGVVVSIWLGSAVLLVALMLMVYAFWIWERTSKSRVILRAITITIAAAVYLWFVGTQVYSQWRKEHHAVPKTTVEQQPSAPPPTSLISPPSAPTQSSAKPHHHLPRTTEATTKPSTPTSSPTVQQNCPNGICIGGDNLGSATVNNFGPPTRKLSSQQISALSEIASRIPDSQTVDLFTANTKESDEYGTAIQEAMNKAAKPPQLKPGPTTSLVPFSKPAPTGTVICVKEFSSPTMALAKEIGNVLVSDPIVKGTISRCSGVEDNEVRIIIAEP